jgi:hypothetical protein
MNKKIPGKGGNSDVRKIFGVWEREPGKYSRSEFFCQFFFFGKMERG